MLDALNQILGFFQSVFDWFLSFIESLAFAVNSVSASVEYTLLFTGLVPSIIGSAIIVFLSVYIVKFIIGR